MKKIIISMDPGKENFSVCIQTIEDNYLNIEYVKLLEFRIRELKEKAVPPFLDQLDCFENEIKEIIDKYNPIECCMERYQVRFRTMGCTTEVVNVMIGVISSICRSKNIPVKLIIASEWKNHFNKVSNISLNDLYKAIKKLPSHIIDSALIGLYAYLDNDNWYKSDNLIKYCEDLKRLYNETN